MIFFFYGTLCDPDVLALVLGYRPGRHQLKPAILPGFRRKIAQGRSYPVLRPAPGGQVQGWLFHARSPEDGRRLDAYEGPEYLTRRRLVWPQGAAAPRLARLYLPFPGRLGAGNADWELPQWRRHYKAAFIKLLLQQTEADSACARTPPKANPFPST